MVEYLIEYVLILILFVFCFVLRFIPHIISPLGIGVDHWFWKAYISKYKQDRQFPPVLPQYILDVHQWYPPLFPLVIAYIPKSFFESHSHLIAVFIDLIRLTLLLKLTYLLTNGQMLAVYTAGIIYATIPLLISYNIQLNPRGLAALFLDILIALLLWHYFGNGSMWLWPIVILIAAIILLTHKMTTQLFFFLCICSGIISLDWRLFLLIPTSILVAILMSRGFYTKVAIAHWDVLAFWNRNWQWRGAHPIKESPIYGQESYESTTRQHKKGIRGVLKHVCFLFAYNPAGWMIFLIKIITGIRRLSGGTFTSFHNIIINMDLTMFYWIFLLLFFMLLWATLTVLVPFMRCLGMGYLYLYNAAFPAALLWGIAFYVSVKDKIIWIEYMSCVFISLLCIVVFYKHLKNSKTKKIDSDFDNALNYLKQKTRGVVMCLPMQWLDVVAYKTRQPVLYGGHGYGFKILEPVFPRLLIPMSHIIDRYGVRYLLTINGYLPDNFLKELEGMHVREFGEYQIYHIKCDLD
ncbi:MAG: hypothetical protein HQL10_05990 [Nitrospirae bacterium]|nr:hypothetical protein [Nitrospirota bacterium]